MTISKDAYVNSGAKPYIDEDGESLMFLHCMEHSIKKLTIL